MKSFAAVSRAPEDSAFPARLAVLVPVHHDGSSGRTARADRAALLQSCLASIVAASNFCRMTSAAFREISIIVVDDYSPEDPGALLDADTLRNTRWLRNQGAKGQAGALNFAMANVDADAFAFTDSDCVVAPDWLQCIADYYRAHPAHGGVCGPNWLFGPAVQRWSRILTAQEAALMRFLTETEIDRCRSTTTRIDCRNLSLRVDFAARLQESGELFGDGVCSVSGQASYFLKSRLMDGEVPVGFCQAMQTFHQPISSLLGQMAVYYARGRWSRFDEIYASLYGSLRAALVKRYAMRHFIAPMVSGSASFSYVWPVHLAFWAGIVHRRYAGQRQENTRLKKPYPEVQSRGEGAA